MLLSVLIGIVFLSACSPDIRSREDYVRAQLNPSENTVEQVEQENVWSRHSRVSLRAASRESGTIGILFFAYGADEKTFESFRDQAFEAARLFKEFSPKLKLALVTSCHHDDHDHTFDHQIVVREDHNFAGSNYQQRPDGLERQWLTRILYMTATPFEVTIAYDANVIPCGDIMPAVIAMSVSDFDLAVASTGNLAEDIAPHNFAIAYRWNKKLVDFFDEWFMTQVSAGVSLDDQHTLRRAVAVMQGRFPTFKYRIINPVMAAAFASTDAAKGFYPRETRVITGKALVIHANPYSASGTCKLFNENVTKRQIFFDGKHHYVTFSSEECAQHNNGLYCRYSALWTGVENLLIPPTRIGIVSGYPDTTVPRS